MRRTAGATAGLWIDHREAVIVVVSAKGETTKVIKSNVKKQHGRIGSEHSTAPDDRRQDLFTVRLNGYYDKVITAIRDAKSILIFCPGEAKGELKRRIESRKSSGKIVAVETTDKMTNRQIAAKVRKYVPVKKM